MIHGRLVVLLVLFCSFLFPCSGAHALWKRLREIRPRGGPSLVTAPPTTKTPRGRIIRQDNTTSRLVGFPSRMTQPFRKLPQPQRNGMKQETTVQPSEGGGQEMESSRKTQNVCISCLGYLCQNPFQRLAPDPFVELVTLTNGNLDLCRFLAYGRAVLVFVPAWHVVQYLCLYEINLWMDMFRRLSRDAPWERLLFVSILLVSGVLVFGALRSIQYACEYWNQEDLWFRALGLGKYNRIWKETLLWQEEHRKKNTAESSLVSVPKP